MMPFTQDQFLGVFAAYNRALWPGVALLWLLTLGALLHLRRAGPAASRLVAAVLAIHWAWSSVAYQLAFFREINPVATVFAGLFLAQAALFLWLGVLRSRLSFETSASVRGTVALALIAYALVYPGLGVLSGLTYPRAPSFGVPCPTTILTAGLLLLLPRDQARALAAIPLAWTAVGGSAVFLLGIPADAGLIVAGLLLLGHVVRPAARAVPGVLR